MCIIKSVNTFYEQQKWIIFLFSWFCVIWYKSTWVSLASNADRNNNKLLLLLQDLFTTDSAINKHIANAAVLPTILKEMD